MSIGAAFSARAATMEAHKDAQRSDGWHTVRKGKVTGSKVAAVLGLSPFGGPADAARTLLGLDTFKIFDVALDFRSVREPVFPGDHEEGIGLGKTLTVQLSGFGMGCPSGVFGFELAEAD